MKQIILGKPELELAKKISHEVWQKYDDQFGYRTEKQTYNDGVSTDVPDNIWFFWGQFDSNNQAEFLEKAFASTDKGSAKLAAWATQQMAEVNKSLQSLHDAGIDL